MIDWLSVAILLAPWTFTSSPLWLRLILAGVVGFALAMADRRHKELQRRIDKLERELASRGARWPY